MAEPWAVPGIRFVEIVADRRRSVCGISRGAIVSLGFRTTEDSETSFPPRPRTVKKSRSRGSSRPRRSSWAITL